MYNTNIKLLEIHCSPEHWNRFGYCPWKIDVLCVIPIFFFVQLDNLELLQWKFGCNHTFRCNKTYGCCCKTYGFWNQRFSSSSRMFGSCNRTFDSCNIRILPGTEGKVLATERVVSARKCFGLALTERLVHATDRLVPETDRIVTETACLVPARKRLAFWLQQQNAFSCYKKNAKAFFKFLFEHESIICRFKSCCFKKKGKQNKIILCLWKSEKGDRFSRRGLKSTWTVRTFQDRPLLGLCTAHHRAYEEVRLYILHIT